MHKKNFKGERILSNSESVNGDVDLKQIDNKKIDIMSANILDFPIIENPNNAQIWPEEVKGGIDLTDTYEITQVPEGPDTPLESVETLKKKGIIPKD